MQLKSYGVDNNDLLHILLWNPQGNVDCVEMTNDADHPGKWNDVECETTMNAYLCQIPLGKFADG